VSGGTVIYRQANYGWQALPTKKQQQAIARRFLSKYVFFFFFSSLLMVLSAIQPPNLT